MEKTIKFLQEQKKICMALQVELIEKGDNDSPESFFQSGMERGINMALNALGREVHEDAKSLGVLI
jgi:hypothetical protein